MFQSVVQKLVITNDSSTMSHNPKIEKLPVVYLSLGLEARLVAKTKEVVTKWLRDELIANAAK